MSSAIDSSSSASWTSPGAGITGGYNGKSASLRTFIVFMAGLAMAAVHPSSANEGQANAIDIQYNACELITIIFLTFARFRGMYFWSMLIAAIGIIPYALGFMLKFLNITTRGDVKWLAIVLLTLGWWPMITGQSLVLWSRLHLIVSGENGERIIRWSKYMIITNFFLLHIPTTVLTFGANGSSNTRTFETAYNIMEKVQMIGFFLQELILSSIYIVETVKLLRTSLQLGTRKTMKQLIFMNVVIIVMDLGLLGLESASLYILQILLKGVVYSIKLKLEFAILGKLVQFVRATKPGNAGDRSSSVGFITTSTYMSREEKQMNVQDFVDLNRVSTEISHRYPMITYRHCNLLPPRRKSTHARSGLSLRFEYKLARFEHVDYILTLPIEDNSPRDSLAFTYDGEV